MRRNIGLAAAGPAGPAATAQCRQEAQLPQRNSASAAHMEGGWG